MKSPVFLITLLLLFVISVGCNFFLFQQAQKWYLNAQALQLDPNEVFRSNFPPPSDGNSSPLVLFFGDSRAKQWVTPSFSGYRFANRGIGGQSSQQVLGRFEAHVIPLRPQIIVIQVGINDLKTIPLFPDKKDWIVRQCQENIKQIVDRSLEAGYKVIVTTIFPTAPVPFWRQPWWSSDAEQAIADVNQFIRSLESNRVDILESKEVLCEAQNEYVNPAYSKDFLHLTTEGYYALNQALQEVLETD